MQKRCTTKNRLFDVACSVTLFAQYFTFIFNGENGEDLLGKKRMSVPIRAGKLKKNTQIWYAPENW